MTEKTPNTMTLTRGQLRGLLKIAGKKDVRYHLNSIFLDFDRKLAVATDGRALTWIPVECEGTGSAIIGRDTLDPLTKGGQRALPQKLEFTVNVREDTHTDPSTFTVNDTANGSTVSGTCMPARFPNYLNVIPSKLAGGTAQFDPQLVTNVHKALEDITDRKSPSLRINHNGPNGAALARFGDNFAVIMPMRDKSRAGADTDLETARRQLDPTTQETAETETD